MELYAKKSLGQHFLNSKHVLEQIMAAGDIRPDEQVLEIGPGTGILTERLLKAGTVVIAVEKDDRALELLKEKFAPEINTGRLRLIHGDVLETDLRSIFPSLLEGRTTQENRYALIANIPYYITGAILEKFLEHEPRPYKMVLLVQKEVADRIIARPAQGARKGKESILSISVKAFGTPRFIAKVPKNAFTPPPSVDSAILSIEDISGERFASILSKKPDGIAYFFSIVRAGFAHKRKLLKRNLESVIDKASIDALWKETGLDDKIRAEDMSPDAWITLVETLVS